MMLVALAWIYIVVLMAIVEAMSPSGTLLGAFFTLLLYGVLPLSIVLYLLGTPARRARRASAGAGPLPSRLRSPRGDANSVSLGAVASARADPDRGAHAPGDAVAPERIEP